MVKVVEPAGKLIEKPGATRVPASQEGSAPTQTMMSAEPTFFKVLPSTTLITLTVEFGDSDKV
jgi:hypothetical protein